jgi:hypothetical protein
VRAISASESNLESGPNSGGKSMLLMEEGVPGQEAIPGLVLGLHKKCCVGFLLTSVKGKEKALIPTRTIMVLLRGLYRGLGIANTALIKY